MEHDFPSKVDAWLAAVLAVSIVVALGAVVQVLVSDEPAAWWIAALLLGAGVALPLWVLLGTRYHLDAGALHVRSGPFKWRIPVESITSITPTKDPRSGPALSLSRLRVDYANGKSLLVSPRDEERFLRALESARGRQTRSTT
jgi:hypothetical protein